MGIMKSLVVSFRNSIHLKLILIYVLSLLIVYLVTWWALSVFLFQPQEKERMNKIEYNLEKIVGSIRSIRENYDNILYRLSNNRIIYKSLSDKCRNYEDVWEALTNIKYTLNEDMARSSTIKKLEVYQQGSDIGQDGRYVFADGFDEEKRKNPAWRTEVIDGTVLLCKYQKVFSLYNDTSAYIKIAVESQEAFGTAVDSELDTDVFVYLTDSHNKILAASDPAASDADFAGILKEPEAVYTDGVITVFKDLMIVKESVDEDWDVWLFVPAKQYMDKVNQAKNIAGVVLLGYGICSAIALSLLLSQVFGRLKKLGERMEQIKGEISYISIPDRFDEVTVLEIKYNTMLEKLENTIDEMAEVRNQKQKFELKSLESQINPHFLYNTLGVMRWEALESGNRKLVAMIDDLTAFYRLSLNKGQGLLKVEQEIKLVKAYVNIQQMRWDYVVDVVISMDLEISQVIVPKMILQPLVENIWLHGNITAEGNRKIEVLAKNAGSYVEFRIWDNGDGISTAVLNNFNKNIAAEGDSFGIGIQFIRNILKHYYGINYVYEVSSNQQEGTLVRIKLPKEMGVMS